MLKFTIKTDKWHQKQPLAKNNPNQQDYFKWSQMLEAATRDLTNKQQMGLQNAHKKQKKIKSNNWTHFSDFKQNIFRKKKKRNSELVFIFVLFLVLPSNDTKIQDVSVATSSNKELIVQVC